MPSGFLLDSPAASSEGFPEDPHEGFPGELFGYSGFEEDGDALTEDSDVALQFDWTMVGKMGFEDAGVQF